MMKKIVFKVRFSPGDILMFTAALRDMHVTWPGEYLTDVRCPAPEIFENSPFVTAIDDSDADYFLMIQYEMIHQSGWNGQHFSEGLRQDIGERLGLIRYLEEGCGNDLAGGNAGNAISQTERGLIREYLENGTCGTAGAVSFTRSFIKEQGVLKQVVSTGLRPDLHLSDDEKVWVNQVAAEFGYHGRFWVINAGWKDDFPLKRYPYWQEVVEILNRHIQLVQVGHEAHHHPPLNGVFNLVGKTDLRQLVRLFYHAEGALGVVSLPMVMASALEKPYVCVAGGREGVRWQLYPDQAFLKTNGWLDCCAYDGCWKSRNCVNLVGSEPRCMSLVAPEEVAGACLKYYQGGRLKF